MKGRNLDIKSSSKGKKKEVNKQIFSSPGSLIYVGPQVNESATARLLEYNESNIFKENYLKLKSVIENDPKQEYVKWLNVDGVHDVPLVEKIGNLLNLHPLILEDLLNTFQKPKYENYDDKYIFISLRVPFLSDSELSMEYISIILGDGWVASFQEKNGREVFVPVLDRLNSSIGKTRKAKADYLFYTLCDVLIDCYLSVLDAYSDSLEELELHIIESPNWENRKYFYKIRRDLLTIRKSALPMKEIFGALLRESCPLINESSKIYFRDVSDHVLQTVDTVDSYREMLENIQNIHLSDLSNRMNSVMKTLTVYTAVFMPLTFIVGIYGMNFENMPELKSPNGYFYTLGGMALLAFGMWIYFKWKKFI